eukprot:9498081-Pyramimonas_sp.AAC.2
MGKVRVFLHEKSMWLTVTAPKGVNSMFPNGIAIGDIKGGISLAASTYEGKQDEIHIYDGSESLAEDTAISGGYEYLNDYVVQPGIKLYASLEQQNVAGVHDATEDAQKKEWDGLTWIQIVDEGNRWTQVMLPDNLPDGQVLTANMLKRSVLAKINKSPTPQTIANMRVFDNDSGVAAGQPYKGTDKVRATSWYSVAIDANLPMLMVQSGSDLPSPDTSNDIQGWEDVADKFEQQQP